MLRLSFSTWLLAVLTASVAWAAPPPQNDTDDDKDAKQPPYADLIRADNPVAYWRFEDDRGTAELKGSPWLPKEIVGPAKLAQPGPRQAKFPLFDEQNSALQLTQPASLRYDDPGKDSPLDFARGESLTLEAWVNPSKALGTNQTVYVVGKGRTGNKGVAADNQNWCLRLGGKDGTCRISFLFRDAENRAGQQDDWHRWTSDAGFGGDSGWHHVAVVYTFGKGDSIRGYVDGRETKGTWDYGGKTDEAPLVDDDQVWVGSASGNNAGNSFSGSIDEIALYRSALAPERIAARWKIIQPKPYVTSVPIPAGRVLVEVLEGLPDQWNWQFIPPTPSERFTQHELAFCEVPLKYNPHGVRTDRGSPFVVWASTELDLPAGKHRLLLRSRSAARLYVDEKLIVENPFPSGKTDGHNAWKPVESKISPNIRPLQPGDQEKDATIELTGGPHKLRLEMFIGGKKRRPETGETSVSIAPAGTDDFWVIGHPPLQQNSREQTAPGLSGLNRYKVFPLTDDGWLTYDRNRRDELIFINQDRRRAASAEYAKYWDRRHKWAREYVGQASSLPSSSPSTSRQAGNLPHNSIDSFLDAALTTANVSPTAPADDYAFLRRIYLDCLGIPPTAEQVQAFASDTQPDKRARLIDHLLKQPGWADNWVGYWQDVLAENPNIVNPTLNNTGPFRWWIYESFLDNKPFDRLATELILMEGSTRYGGAAGFEVATENDAPLAAKAQNIGLAFLGFDMRCARCHDAPQHRFTQEDLFNLAAMLHRGEQTLPKTSTIPGDEKSHASLLVQVSLKPGQKIAPKWPFEEDFRGPLSKELLFDPTDEREELALRITSPQNPRFAQVIVNRLWQRYLGRGLVEPVDDWEEAEPTNPDLLAWLARELVLHNYDVQHIARLIFNSRAYQRTPTADDAKAKLVAGPLRRRMTAEQVLDSLLAASGKEMHVEELTVDSDGSRLDTSSISLGLPRRAWQFTSMSNERDRPSLSLPAAQTAVNVLEAFGWRASRQDPLSTREKEPTVIQPAILANGVVAKRAVQFSEDSVFVEFALACRTPAEFVDTACRQILSRPPTEAEKALFVELLSEGFAERATGAKAGPRPGWPKRDGVSWSNHLQSEANEIRLAWQKQVEKGDPPTTRLAPAWRERAEDVVWSLMNSPEFVWIP